ncbi:hypothetical protein BH10CYA1_BH10CYA1_19010 [soil metagenome]
MFLVSLAKHSVELVVVAFLLYVGFLTFFPGAVALNNFMAENPSSSSYSHSHIRLGNSFHLSGATIRPSRLR